MKSLLLAVAMIGTALQHTHAGLSTWNGSSGLLPNQTTPEWSLIDTAPSADPILAAGTLTLSTSAGSELMVYEQSGSALSMPSVLQIEARLRFVSGTDNFAFRAPVQIGFNLAPFVGNTLSFEQDRIFLLNGNLTVGASAVVDTDDAFHTYRIEVSTLTGAIDVFYDSGASPILQSSTFYDVDANPNTQIIYWGDYTGLESGESEWQSFSHNASAVPEPSTFALGFGVLVIGIISRRRRSHERT
jgi:hypothetical protein